MKQEAIPQFIDWASQILSLPCNSTQLSNDIYFSYKY